MFSCIIARFVNILTYNICTVILVFILTIHVIPVFLRVVTEDDGSLRAEAGLDTVFCLDTSGSISEQAFEQMKNMVLDFIDGSINYVKYICICGRQLTYMM